MEIAPKEVFTCINDATNIALRKKFGPPNESDDPRLMPKIAVAFMQASLLYFAQTGAPKEVVRELFDKLMDDVDPSNATNKITQDGNRLILPGQNAALIKKITGR